MRLLIVGTLKGQLSARDQDRHGPGRQPSPTRRRIDQALAVMRAKGADLVMIDVVLPVRDLVARLRGRAHPHARRRLRHRHGQPAPRWPPSRPARANTSPCRPIPELIAAVLEAVSRDNRAFVYPRRGHGARGAGSPSRSPAPKRRS